jgi:hypothetical protein
VKFWTVLEIIVKNRDAPAICLKELTPEIKLREQRLLVLSFNDSFLAFQCCFFKDFERVFASQKPICKLLRTFSAYNPTGYPENSLITLEFIGDRSLFSALMQMFEKRV